VEDEQWSHCFYTEDEVDAEITVEVVKAAATSGGGNILGIIARKLGFYISAEE
jgi:hypothetical protein